jgi:Spy/CpxP family protein refolding chaperone
MKNVILAALAALSLGVGAANAASPNSNTANQQSGDQFNYTRGGGG